MSENHKLFEIKIEHIALVKAICFTPESLSILGCIDTQLTPFGGNDLKSDLADIIVGRELNEFEKQDKLDKGEIVRSREDLEWMLSIYKDILTVLDIVNNVGTFEPGMYRTRWYERNWKRINH